MGAQNIGGDVWRVAGRRCVHGLALKDIVYVPTKQALKSVLTNLITAELQYLVNTYLIKI